MKKRVWILGLVMVLLISGVFGCGKRPVDPQVATEAFINAFMYGDVTDVFDEAFVESAAYKNIFKKARENSRKSLGSMVPFNTDLSIGGRSQTIYDAYLKALKDKGSYTVTVDETGETEGEVDVTVLVTGLDYKGIVKPYIKEAMAQFDGDIELFFSSISRDETLQASYIKHIDTIIPVAEPQTIKLKLILDKENPSKWRIDYANTVDMDDMQYYFLFGTTDLKIVMDEVNEALKESFSNFSGEVNPSYSLSL